MSEEQQITETDEVTTALVVYKNLQLTVNDLTQQFSASHLDNVTLGKVFRAVIGDLTYDGKKFSNKKAAKLYQASFAVLKAKEVLRNDMKNKLNSGEVEISAESKEQLLKEL